MKKIALALATISAFALALPSLASAETVVVKRGHRHMDHGWHHGWHHGHGGKTVIIKHGRHRY